ncbi:LLM class F420-dependent oxidoreductase [Catenulispora subtropica]|uniref:LLM class F420-dependent oxidoreductase n=1 Tax=Catenulispora subtropica TaxID=450798 RepID=UPI0031D0A6A1
MSQVIVDGVLLGNRTDSDPALTLRLAGLADELGYREIWLGESTGHDAFALAVAVAAAAGDLPEASASDGDDGDGDSGDGGGRDGTRAATLSGTASLAAKARAAGAQPATADEFRRKNPGGKHRAALTLGPLPAGVRDPVTAARGAASVATLTGRRVGLALTASTGLVVVDWHGRPRTDPATVLAESLTILGPLTRGDRVSFQGVSVRSRGFSSRLDSSRASLTVLAFGLEASEVAVGRADRVAVPLATVEHAARIKARLALTADRMNRAVPRLAVFLPTVVDPDPASLDWIRRSLLPYLDADGFGRMFAEAGHGELVDLARGGAHERSLMAAMPEEVLRSIAAVGDLNQVCSAFEDYRQAGVDEIVMLPENHDAGVIEHTIRALAK